ncbi:MFS transporter [Kribbella sp. NPDC004875]|uniref:MFS transporter n=1 Tax=Kribbella sp. NPDC004875 TaxID=3364107 RepID=UPI0036B2A333
MVIRPLRTAARRRSMLAVLLAGQAMASIDASIVSVAAQTIRHGLQATDAEIQLVVSGYLLTTGVLFVTCARIGEVIGHRRAFLTGLGWFTAASLLCGISVNPAMLIVSRIAQAVGAALLTPQVFSLIHLQWAGAQRRRAIGLYSMVLALGVALGQICGGLVAGSDLLGLSWRPVFLINVPIGVVVLAFGLRRLPGSPGGVEPKRLDLAGVGLLTAAMTAITLPLIFGGSQSWPTWTWLMLASGGLLLGIFGRYEARARQPVLDLAALKRRDLQFGLVACCIVMGCYTVFLLTLTLHLQSYLGYTPLQAGLAFIPYTIGFGVVSLSWSACPRRVRGALPIAGPLVYATGMFVLVLVSREEWNPLGCTALLLTAGAGHAAGYSPLIAQVTSRVEPELASAVSALNSTGPVLAEVVAVAGLGSLYFAAPTSADGLLRLAVAITALLVVAAVCATLAILVHTRRDTRHPSWAMSTKRE